MKVKNTYGLFHTVNIPTKNINKVFSFFGGGGGYQSINNTMFICKGQRECNCNKIEKKISWLEVFERNPHQPVSHVSCSPTPQTF